MSSASRYGEVIGRYQDLAQDLVGSWTPFVFGISAKVGTRGYGLAQAASDVTTAAHLVSDSLMAVGSGGLGAVAILTTDYNEQTQIAGYGTDPELATAKRKLRLRGDLVSVSGEVLSAERVQIEPRKLAAGECSFVLHVDGNGIKARTYDGHVVATTKAGATEKVFVSVTVG